MQTPLTFLAAFIVVLALIGLAAWLVRRFSGGNLGNNANRGRMPRLAVIDAAAVDGRRRLVLVRRDNVEHLLMIGGPTDVVVELNIVRAMPARDGAPARPGELPRAIPDAAGWSDPDNRPDDLDAVESEPNGRRSAPSFADEVRRMPPPPEREQRRLTESTALAPEMPPARPEPPARQESRESSRPDSGMPRPPRPPRPDVAPRPRLAETLGRLPRPPEPASAAAAPAAQSSSAADAEKELTDMAQRLEAALRRPSAAPPVTAKSSSSAEASATSSAPAVEPPRQPASTSSAPPVNAPEAPSAPGPRTGFENLEDEMASLLGRPKSPS